MTTMHTSVMTDWNICEVRLTALSSSTFLVAVAWSTILRCCDGSEKGDDDEGETHAD